MDENLIQAFLTLEGQNALVLSAFPWVRTQLHSAS